MLFGQRKRKLKKAIQRDKCKFSLAYKLIYIITH